MSFPKPQVVTFFGNNVIDTGGKVQMRSPQSMAGTNPTGDCSGSPRKLVRGSREKRRFRAGFQGAKGGWAMAETQGTW